MPTFKPVGIDENSLFPDRVETRLSTTIDGAVAPVTVLANSARSMAIRGFSPKTRPLKKMWAFPGAVGHGFVSAGSTGTVFNLNDTADFSLGDRSVSLTTAGTGAANSTYARLAKTGLTIDATGNYVRIWLKISDVTRLTTLNLILGDNALANTYQAQLFNISPMGSSVERKSIIKSGEWTAVDVPWSSFTVSAGTPSRSAITAAAVLAFDGGSTVGPVTVRWNGVGGVAEDTTTYPNGVISLTFDDTYSEAFTVARPYMDIYGFAGTLYPIQSLFGTAGRLTEQQALDLMRIGGWDFGYHSTTQATHDDGFDTYTEAQLVTEFETQRAWASQRGIPGDSFAWPLVYFNALSQRVASRYFRTARAGGEISVETLPPSDAYRIRPIPVGSGVTLATLKARVDQVKAGRGWGVFTFHRIVTAGPGSNDTTTAIFQALMDYISAQGVQVSTVGQVMDRV